MGGISASSCPQRREPSREQRWSITEQECEHCPGPTARHILLDRQENHKKNLPWIFPGCLFGFSAPTQALQMQIFCLFFLCCLHPPAMSLCHCSRNCAGKISPTTNLPHLSILCQNTHLFYFFFSPHHLWDNKPHWRAQQLMKAGDADGHFCQE